MKPKVFIDGSEGTTGLQIHERLSGRTDIDLLKIDPDKRKDADERKKLINAADLFFICLPDEAARETITLIENPYTRVIDASSAHRTTEDWTYGLPELGTQQREEIGKAAKVTNPGCHATGIILLLAPLVKKGVIQHSQQLVITSLTGYTGAGKAAIEEYGQMPRDRKPELNAPRLYSTGARHKHIPEIMRYSGLTTEPAFLPVIDDFPQGMQIIIPLFLQDRHREIYDILAHSYEHSKIIEVSDSATKYSPSNINAGTDAVTLKVLGFDDKIILTAQYDNLGKGASGAAVQNMNIMLGFDEYEGMVL